MYKNKQADNIIIYFKRIMKRASESVKQVQWLKLPPWKVGDRGFKPSSGLQVKKKQNVSSPLTRKDSILWGASVSQV